MVKLKVIYCREEELEDTVSAIKGAGHEVVRVSKPYRRGDGFRAYILFKSTSSTLHKQ